MSTLKKSALAIVLITMFGGTAFFVFDTFRGAETTAEQSCLYSVLSATARARRSGSIVLDENVKSRELTSDEVKLVIEQYGVGDCGGREDALAKVHISIGDVNKVSLTKIRVWTNGRDGISETGDDNIIPWEENLHP